MKLKIKKVRPTGVVPEFKTEYAAGMDFHASLEGIENTVIGKGDREFVLMPGAWYSIPLGVAVQLEPGYEMQIRPRSGLALKYGIGMVNSPGTIDADYTGEIHAVLINHSRSPFIITEGMRVCQGVVSAVQNNANKIIIEEVEELDKTERGSNGFGHTGV